VQYTSNFNLKKPDGTDVVNVQDFNDNADILDTELKKVKDTEIKYGTASGTNTYTVTISGITSLTEGLSVKVKFTNANTGASTLNINGLGAKAIQKAGGTALSSGNIKAGQVCHLVYTGSVFQLLGEGGEYGNVTADKVLQGVTFGTESGLATGTMPNQGAISYSLPINGTYTIPAGYHNGSGKVTQSIPTKAAATITPGTTDQTIAAGQYLSGTQTIASLGGNATQADVLTGRTFSSNAVGRAVSGTMPNNGAWNGTITLSNSTSGSVTIPTGYHSGGGKVTATVNDANLVASNIREGKSILGVTGTLHEGKYNVGDVVDVSTFNIADPVLIGIETNIDRTYYNSSIYRNTFHATNKLHACCLMTYEEDDYYEVDLYCFSPSGEETVYKRYYNYFDSESIPTVCTSYDSKGDIFAYVTDFLTVERINPHTGVDIGSLSVGDGVVSLCAYNNSVYVITGGGYLKKLGGFSLSGYYIPTNYSPVDQLIDVDDSGNVYVVYVSGGYWYLQKLNSTGTVLWTKNTGISSSSFVGGMVRCNNNYVAVHHLIYNASDGTLIKSLNSNTEIIGITNDNLALISYGRAFYDIAKGTTKQVVVGNYSGDCNFYNRDMDSYCKEVGDSDGTIQFQIATRKLIINS